MTRKKTEFLLSLNQDWLSRGDIILKPATNEYVRITANNGNGYYRGKPTTKLTYRLHCLRLDIRDFFNKHKHYGNND